MLRGVPGTALAARLADAGFVADSVCAVGGLDLRPARSPEGDECRIGDALTMIPPFTGNGMSMAIEAAGLAAAPLEDWSRGRGGWGETSAFIASRCEAAFRRRLTWANRLHALMFIAPLQPAVAAWLPRSRWSWNFLFSHTR
jgi:2-polyprenyl-6-methoxyphenol hydroxylase-like FAD-dependent oxidoreductase